MKFALIALILSLGSLACSRSSGEEDNVPPSITIGSPGSGQVFDAGETVIVAGQLSDNVKITEVHVHISNIATGALLIDIHRNPDAALYTLHESFQTAAGIQYKIQVIAKDNSANENRSTVEISTN